MRERERERDWEGLCSYRVIQVKNNANHFCYHGAIHLNDMSNTNNKLDLPSSSLTMINLNIKPLKRIILCNTKKARQLISKKHALSLHKSY